MSEDFFGDLGKSITRATQKAVGRTGSLIESTKINAMMGAELKSIEKLYTELGEMVFDRCTKGFAAEESWAPVIEEIRTHKAKVQSLRGELADIKGMRVCSSCGELIDSKVPFCPMCGAAVYGGEDDVRDAARLAEAVAKEAAEETVDEAPDAGGDLVKTDEEAFEEEEE